MPTTVPNRPSSGPAAAIVPRVLVALHPVHQVATDVLHALADHLRGRACGRPARRPARRPAARSSAANRCARVPAACRAPPGAHLVAWPGGITRSAAGSRRLHDDAQGDRRQQQPGIISHPPARDQFNAVDPPALMAADPPRSIACRSVATARGVPQPRMLIRRSSTCGPRAPARCGAPLRSVQQSRRRSRTSDGPHRGADGRTVCRRRRITTASRAPSPRRSQIRRSPALPWCGTSTTRCAGGRDRAPPAHASA